MLHTHVQSDGPWQQHLRQFPPTPKTKRVDLVLGSIGFVLVVTFVIIWFTARAPSPAALSVNSNPVPVGNTIAIASASGLRGDLTTFEQTAHNLAVSNSPETLQTLIQLLKQSEPLSTRSMVLTALKDASPLVAPELINALNDPDAGVRAGAAQVLGLRGEHTATVALIDATRDPDASVRRQAVKSLGTLDAWQVLPRLEQLIVNETNSDVSQAAIAVQESFNTEIAAAIGVRTPELRDISVTASDVPQIYAVTTSNLYALHGTAWTLISRLPDAPLAIATGADPNLLFLATVSTGLYRSLDGGQIWEHVQFGLGTPTQLTVTAVVVDSQNSRLYIALASQGAEPGTKDPLGISESNDAGATWETLKDSPTNVITTRLVIDPQTHAYLFGMAGDTSWRYALPNPVCDDCQN